MNNVDISSGKLEAAACQKKIAELSLEVQQAAAWSDTPDHDRGCVDFVLQKLGVIALAGDKAIHVGHCVPADYKPDVALHGALRDACKKEVSKQHLRWLLGSELASEFLGVLTSMLESIAPANADHQKENGLANIRGWGGLAPVQQHPAIGKS